MSFRHRTRIRRLLDALRPAAPDAALAPAPAAPAPAPPTPIPAARPVAAPRAPTRELGVFRRASDEPQVDFVPKVRLSSEVAQRFNAYAAAAFPYEIGGMLRVVQLDNGDWEAVDLRIFPQEVSPVYFELDGSAVAKFNMGLFRDGKKDELPEWRALIHSHPDMTPFMSGPDRENIERLAGKKFAFSFICSAHADPNANYYAVHYAQGGPVALVVHDLPVKGQGLAGISGVSDEDLRAIEAEVEALCTDIRDRSRRPHAGDLISLRDNAPALMPRASAPKLPAGPIDDVWDSPDPEDEAYDTSVEELAGEGVFHSGAMTDVQYELVDSAVGEALRSGDRELLEAVRGACDSEEDITDADELDALALALAAAVEQMHADDTPGETIGRAEKLMEAVRIASETATEAGSDELPSTTSFDA